MPRLQYRWRSTLTVQWASAGRSATWPVHHKHGSSSSTHARVSDVSPAVKQRKVEMTDALLAQPAGSPARSKSQHLPESFRSFLVAWHNHLQRFREVFTQRGLRDVGWQVAEVQQAKE